MDDCDLGARNADFFRDQAMARAKAQISEGESSAECIDCGEAIPEARRVAVQGCQRCIECATAFEEGGCGS